MAERTLAETIEPVLQRHGLAEVAQPLRFIPEAFTDAGHYEMGHIVTENARGEIITIAEIPPGPMAERYGYILAASLQMLETIHFVKTWMDHLDDGLPEDDPMYAMLQRFYAPVHSSLDKSIAMAKGGAQ